MNKYIKKILALSCVMVLVLQVTSCSKKEDFQAFEVETETNYIAIQVKDMGTIIAELYPDVAPITVAHIKKVIADQYYNGKVFHRAVPNFVIQGGSLNGDGLSDGDAETIKGEFALNGVYNSLTHGTGVLSMARTGEPNSGSTQFFIVTNGEKASPALNGNYAAFGKVIHGMDIVKKIEALPVSGESLIDKPVMEKVFFLDAQKAEEFKKD